MDTIPATFVNDLSDTTSENVSHALARLTAACRRLEQLPRLEGSPYTRKFHAVISGIHDICDALGAAEQAGADPRDVRAIIAGAREIHGHSPFIRRLQEWPRGYPGDFETIEWLCRAENRAPRESIAHIFETYALTASIAQQHRNKVALQAGVIRQAMSETRNCNVLSIGCGSCPDVRSLKPQATAGARFVLCDSDADALALSQSELAPISEQCRFVHGFVPRVLRHVRKDGPFHVILAGGLFDYLSDRLVIMTLREAWHSLLAPGGRIFFTNMARGNPFRLWLEYLASWSLIERSEQDIVRLCQQAGITTEPALARDATQLAIVATLHKVVVQ